MANSTAGELPGELDFFKYAQGGTTSGKRKADSKHVTSTAKKKKLNHEDSDAESEPEEHEPTTSMPRQRVTAKGNNVPDPVETFEALRERYNLSSRLLSNLAQSGYKQPTGIQSHGIPILLEVRLML